MPELHSNNGRAKSAVILPLPAGENRIEQHLDDVPELGRDPNLIETIQRDIAALGVVGEQDTTLLIHLTGTSRLLDHPLRLISRGPSGGGKSFSVNQVKSLFPAGEVIDAMSLSPQVLLYGEPGWLEHKFLVNGERSQRNDEEQADKTMNLRQLISEDYISREVTINFKKVRLEQKGPVAYCETTTAHSIFAEDLNRCLQIYADDSDEQTDRILRATAEEYDVASDDKPDPDEIRKRHHAFQQALKTAGPVDVRFAYAKELAQRMPKDKVEARRAFKQVLATIEAIAFLHQFQRERDDAGHLLATLDDYELARRLLLVPINESLGRSARASADYDRLRAAFPKKGITFTSNEAVDKEVCKNKMAFSRMAEKLREAEVIEVVAPARGKDPAAWGWTGKTIEPVLPTADQLCVTRNGGTKKPALRTKPLFS